MALCEMHLNAGSSLHKMTSFSVIVPEWAPGPFSVLYLLHGLTDDHTAWARRSNIERYVEFLPLIVVMPNSERGWYTDSLSNPHDAFETYITQDLIGFMDRTFQTIPTREGRVIAGLSMGGYGAAKLALKHPDLFCAAVSHSGAVEIASVPLDDASERGKELRAVFGANPVGGSEDIFALAARADPATRPLLRVDCGVDDFLIEHNRRFHAHLERVNYPHEYVENPGAHNWDYWDRHIQDTLNFFRNVLGIKDFDPQAYRR